MLISNIRRALVAMGTLVLVLTACGDGDKSEPISATDSVLRFVPADTPYVFATTGQAPDALIDKMTPHMDATLGAYHGMIRAVAENAYAEAREEDKDLDMFEQFLPLLDELESLMSVDGFADAGIDRDSQFAIYGAGILPVMRVTLSDSELMEATMTRLEEKADKEMMTATVDGQSYRYFGDEKGRIVVAILGDNLVMTMVPTELPTDQLKEVLGLTLPAQDIASAGTLAKISDEYGFTNYMVGLVDFERIVKTFVEPPSGVNAALMDLLDYERSELNDVCKAEIETLAGIMPRAVMGYTELTTERIASRGIFELRDDIASSVSTLTAPVPGLGVAQGGLFTFGMSTDLLAMRTFYTERLDALEESPFECELFADLQAGVASGRDILNQPIPPIVYGFKGFLAVVDEIEGLDIAAQQPPTSVDMRMLLAMENAEALLAMGAMFSPELASLSLEPNGEPVKLNLPQVDAIGQIVHVALSDSALGISVGDGTEDGLGDLLASDNSDRRPFMYGEMDASAYYEFVNDSMTGGDNGLAEMAEIQAAISAMNTASSALMDRINFSINFTENGVEFESGLTLKD